ncbi:nucleotidyltransferase domain-containing protein [Caldivirga sp.]|uniref:nucleotidyltransferase domain-containing protein n=1 Tax=Caldivirga sp. TaxID=2080243 RepID=UPI0025C01AAD|nr:nucleotidyltransferase domain-containing protein [Caldivirga sp.]
MFRYYRELGRVNEDFRRNKLRYFKKIIEIAEEYNGKAYLFGSQLRGSATAASDVDILVEVPCGVNWLEVLARLRREVGNPKFEFHVRCGEEAKLMKRMIKEYEDLESMIRKIK